MLFHGFPSQKSFDFKNQRVLESALHLKHQLMKFSDGDCPLQSGLFPPPRSSLLLFPLSQVTESPKPATRLLVLLKESLCYEAVWLPRRVWTPGSDSRGHRFCFYLCCCSFPFATVLMTCLAKQFKIGVEKPTSLRYYLMEYDHFGSAMLFNLMFGWKSARQA